VTFLISLSSSTTSESLAIILYLAFASSHALIASVHWPRNTEYIVAMLLLWLKQPVPPFSHRHLPPCFSQIHSWILVASAGGSSGWVSAGSSRFSMAFWIPAGSLRFLPAYLATSLLPVPFQLFVFSFKFNHLNSDRLLLGSLWFLPYGPVVPGVVTIDCCGLL